MLSKAKISYVQSLKQKKFRQKYNNFFVEGDKSARELLDLSHTEIEFIFALPAWAEKNALSIRKYGEKLLIVNPIELKKISQLKTPNQVLVVARQLDDAWSEEKVTQGLSLYLDGIQDPGNMGTILRIADWFGIEYVFCSKGCADIYNPKVIQSTMGAFMRVKAPQIGLSFLKEKFPDLPILGALMEGESIYSLKKMTAGVLVIGNEGQGISEEAQAFLTHKITIPAPVGSGAESLNAGVATGIIVSHLVK